jgi:mannose-6-phosphate isomerase-like protein (cupin superfamily)
MEAYDIGSAFGDLGEVEFRTLATFNRGTIGVFWASSGISPWERHPDDEELLQVIEGSVDIEVLTAEGSEITTVSAGSVFVVPRGHWHRHRHTGVVKELYLTPGPSDTSFEEDPRVSSGDT